jgi:hypothetical protein
VDNNVSAPARKVDTHEEEARGKAVREMKAAALVITLSFVFVIVAIVLVVIIGHIQLF